ncbi:MAG: arginine--tRNA ligase [bacterium]
MIKKRLASMIEQAMEQAKSDGLLTFDKLPPIDIEPPRNRAFGDYSTNIAMLLRKEIGGDPRKIAETLASYLMGMGDSEIEKVEVAGGGFVNLTLNKKWLGSALQEVVSQGSSFGKQNIGEGKRVLLEFVSANPTGPIHIAHARGGVFGDVLARLLETLGYRVEREFYVNDATNSTQMYEFAKSLQMRYRQLLGDTIDLNELGYRGEYMIELAEGVRAEYGDHLADGILDEVVSRFRNIGQEVVFENQKVDLADFGIAFDTWFSEQTLHDKGEVTETLESLRVGGYTYESEGAVWLRSTAFGDDKDRVLVRSNSQPTYIAADAAYHRDKFERGFDSLIDIWGPDHHGYIARTKAAVGSLGYDPERLKILIYQIVKLYRGNEEVRLSKRTGNVVTLREVLDEVGRDVTRFFLLMRSHDTDLNFDIELAKRQSDENPVFYVQYAHARICSVIKKAEEQGIKVPTGSDVDLSLLTHETEIELIKRLIDFPGELRRVTELYEPHRLTTFAQELARLFHLFYDVCRVIGDDPATTGARLVLINATRIVLHNTLELLGVTAPDFMERREVTVGD